ncbi:hypothetical protein IscW_ISCW011714, partial [Ixodes scapularis]
FAKKVSRVTFISFCPKTGSPQRSNAIFIISGLDPAIQKIKKKTRRKYLTLRICARKDWWQNKSSPRSAEKGLDTNKISHQSTSCAQDTGRVFSNVSENHAPLRRVQPKGNAGGNDKKLGFPALTFNSIRQNKSAFIE